jgi:hypothetical protein
METALERMFVIFKQMIGQSDLSEELRSGAQKHVKNCSMQAKPTNNGLR